MSCQHHTKGSPNISLVEEMILNSDWLPGSMKDWRRYRIEYGFECSCPEGLIYLPPKVSPDYIESILRDLMEGTA